MEGAAKSCRAAVVSVGLMAVGMLAACGASDTASNSIALSVAAASPTSVTLSWSAPRPGAGYEIYRNGRHLSRTPNQSARAIDTGLTPGTRYCYTVTAVDAVGAGVADSNQSCVVTAALAGWDVSRVDAAPPLSLGLDSQGRERMSYCDLTGLVYQAEQADGSWSAGVIDPDAACFNAPIAVGDDDSVHIVYTGSSDAALRYATDASGNWVVTQIPGTEGAMFYTLAVDDGGHAHLAYLLFTGLAPHYYQLVYASDASGTWQESVVADGLAYPSLAVDAQGRAAIAYIGIASASDPYPVHCLRDAGGVWTDSTVTTSADAKSLAALTLDAAGNAYLLFKEQNRLEYLTDASGRWQQTQVDGFAADGREEGGFGAYDVSIDLGPDRQVNLSYEDADGNLKYAHQNAGGWALAYVDTLGTQNQLRMDRAGHAHIAYAGTDNLYSIIAVSP